MPCTSARSFTAIGRPWSQPLRGLLSAALASARSTSRGRSEITALIAGFTFSMRSRWAVITSTAEAWRAAMRVERAVAESAVRSVMAYTCRGARRAAQGAAASTSAQRAISSSSAPKRAARWMPIGRPPAVMCSGSEAAGWPEALKAAQKGE